MSMINSTNSYTMPSEYFDNLHFLSVDKRIKDNPWEQIKNADPRATVNLFQEDGFIREPDPIIHEFASNVFKMIKARAEVINFPKDEHETTLRSMENMLFWPCLYNSYFSIPLAASKAALIGYNFYRDKFEKFSLKNEIANTLVTLGSYNCFKGNIKECIDLHTAAMGLYSIDHIRSKFFEMIPIEALSAIGTVAFGLGANQMYNCHYYKGFLYLTSSFLTCTGTGLYTLGISMPTQMKENILEFLNRT